MSYAFCKIFPDTHKKMKSGDSISDSDLAILINEYSQIIIRLELLGPEYSLAVNELRRLKNFADDYMRERKQSTKNFDG